MDLLNNFFVVIESMSHDVNVPSLENMAYLN